MESGPLAGSVAKLERAKFHFESLGPEIDAFFDLKPEPYRLVTKVDVESSRYLGRISITRQPPLNLSVIVGDYLQNLRSALDHLAWQLVIANGETPTRATAFPIFDQLPPEDPSQGERARWERTVAGIHSDALGFIEFCQPYKGLDSPGPHTLSMLRILSNEDKHRTLLPSLCAVSDNPENFAVDLVELRNVRPPTEKVQVRAGRPLKDGDLVFEAPVTIIGPDPVIKAKGQIPLDVGWGRKPVPLKGLKQMGELVDMILTRCSDFVSA